MEGRQKPDSQPENENDLDDGEIIDLTQIVQGAEDDEIIDLTQVLESPDQTAHAVDEPDEEIIPLVDAVSPQEPAPGLEEEIIDLKDMERTFESDIPEPTDDAPAPQPEEAAPAADEDVIDLLNAVEPEPAMPEAEAVADLESRAETLVNDTMESAALEAADAAPALQAEEPAPAADEDVIDLLDAVEPEPAAPEAEAVADLESRAEDLADDTMESAAVVEEPRPMEEPAPAAETAAELADDLDAEIGEEPTDKPAPDEPMMYVPPVMPMTEAPPTESLALSEAQLETALERVIERIYAEKIEQLMIQTIEKTVQREIEKIKEALIEDDDGLPD